MIAKKLWDAGHRDLVLIRPNDKAPAIAGWLHNRPTLEEVETWRGGLGVIAENTPAVDVDLYDEGLADEVVADIVGFLGAAPMRLSHRPASRLLPYRTTQPFPKKVLTLPDGKGKIEILGRGRQYVISGIHPEGTPYSWARSALWDVPHHALNILDEERADDLLFQLQVKHGGHVTAGRGKEKGTEVQHEDLLAPDLSYVEAILGSIPNTDALLLAAFPNSSDARDAWVAMAHAVYGAGGPQAEHLFLAWTAAYQDGPVDLTAAGDTYRSCADTYTGWPTLRRILRDHCRTDATDEFEADMGPAPVTLPTTESIQYTHEWVVAQIERKLRDTLAYASGGWFVWSGSAWTPDNEKGLHAERAFRGLLTPFALGIMDLSRGTPDKGEKQALAKFARSIQSGAGINSLLMLARAVCLVDINSFDCDPLALNTPGGLVDLRTGELRPTTPEDRVTRVTSVAPRERYRPQEAPYWERFLDHLCGGDENLAAFLQRYMGYCLTGLMGEKKFMFVWGADSNTGKSTFVNAVRQAFGTYARAVGVSVFMGKRKDTDSQAQLPGVRLVTATEPSSGSKWDDELIKAVTGSDPLEARQLYKSNFTFQPQFKVLIAGNHEPELKNVDTALLDRVMITPMNNVVAQPDKMLADKLATESASILRWMIEGYLSVQEQGLNLPEAVLVATQNYADEEDTVAQFLVECCEMIEDEFTSTSDLYRAWAQWNESRGRRHIRGIVGFARDISARRIHRRRKDTVRGFAGIRILPRVRLGTEEDVV